MTQSSPTSSEPRLSQLAKHLKYPDGIVRSDWNAVSRLAAKCGIMFDRWQAGLGTLLFGKTKDGQYAAGTTRDGAHMACDRLVLGEGLHVAERLAGGTGPVRGPQHRCVRLEDAQHVDTVADEECFADLAA